MENNSPPLPQRKRLTTEEVRNRFGIGALLLLVWEIWCIRDGWFPPDPHYEYIGFSRFMACVSFPVLAFCAAMAVSAWRALERRREPGNQSGTANPPGSQL
jgi:hypothetical protein